MKIALLIVGHGSKSPEAVEAFNDITDLVRKRELYEYVEGAHMELSEPSIESVVNTLAGRNVNEIIVAPYFLYEGMHIKKDIPEIIEKLSNEYSEINFKIAKPIGFDPVMADIIIKRAGDVA